jgi:hypothetical protein
MGPQKIIGLVLLVGGIVFFMIGENASHSFADSMSNTFTGKFTDRTTWYIVGGAISVGLGMMAMLMPGAKST